jgi:hypothetical protein
MVTCTCLSQVNVLIDVRDAVIDPCRWLPLNVRGRLSWIRSRMDVQIVVLCCPDSQSCDQSIEDHHSITHRNPRDTLAVDYSCMLFCQTSRPIVRDVWEYYTCRLRSTHVLNYLSLPVKPSTLTDTTFRSVIHINLLYSNSMVSITIASTFFNQ